MRRMTWIVLALGIAVAGQAQASDCQALVIHAPADTVIESAAVVAAGPFAIPAMGPMPARNPVLPAFCRVKGEVAPHIGFELWLPQRNWNGRLLSLGSGGFGGFIDVGSLATYLAQGYAVTANDTGHRGTGMAWMRDPKALLAWGHDATHRVAVAVKTLIQERYGQQPAEAYFQGCSTGGAQAMEEAEFFPGDFDGIVAESPGMDYSHLMLSFLWGLKVTSDNARLSEENLQLLHGFVLASCDAEDGLKDGLLERPLFCHPALRKLLCKAGDKSNCLTSAELRTAELLYQGPRNARTGAEIYPGFVPGSEADASFTGPLAAAYGWSLIQGPLARQYAIPLLKNMVFGPDWDWRHFDWDKDVAHVDAALGGKIDAMDPDLTSFAAHGGKLIMVQGWGDPFNAQTLPIEYRASVIARFGQGLDGAETERAVDNFYRLFMAPGMSHCLGGPGPSKVDALDALRAWVEKSRAPTQLIAQTVRFTSAMTEGAAVRRPLCPYPQYANFIGGNANVSESFRCVSRNGTRGDRAAMSKEGPVRR